MKSFLSFLFILVSSVLSLFCGYGLSKECTNIPTQLSSHTFRYELMSSKNQSWREEMFAHYNHLTPTDEQAWSNLLPRKMLKEEDQYGWTMMYRKLKNNMEGSQSQASGFLKELPLHDVRLDTESMHGFAQQTNLEYLLMLESDSLLWNFRKTAGLPTPGTAYGGWEDPTCELRGHFVGHYLSASAQMWASTGNDILKDKMTTIVSGLAACQDKMGTGYLSAFPTELFDRFEAIKPVWAPYYTIHKIMAGLLEQYTLAKNDQALEMVTRMADYFYNRVQDVIRTESIERHWLSLNEETGGMNDVLYKIYIITRDAKHLVLAHLFDKPCFLGLLAIKADDISGFHANTHIPVVIGSQMRYEVTGDPLYKEIGTYFLDIVNSSHTYATGGTSSGEFWHNPKRLASTLSAENEESCTTYNMLKVSRHLFRWTKETAYADYYERALTNGVLSIQRGREPGKMVYMLPLERGASKARTYHGWGTKFKSFWCCYGTGIESFSKLGDSIYFEEEGQVPSLYIIQFISSSLNWESAKVMLNQKVNPVVSGGKLQVTVTISSKEESSSPESALNFRIPVWTHSDGVKATVNGQELSAPMVPSGNFLTMSRSWNTGDKITLELPMMLRTEAIKDDRSMYASVHAILYGHYLLAGLSSGDWDIKAESTALLSDLISPIPPVYNTQLHSLSQVSSNASFVLTNTNQTITMEKSPESGTDSSVKATFRIIVKDSNSSGSVDDIIGKSVMLEPFDLPGMAIVHSGENEFLGIAHSSYKDNTGFRVIQGLDGRDETISLESENLKDCFLYSGTNYSSGEKIKLSCKHGSADDEFKQGASFMLGDGLSEYHPLSFVAKGANRSFILAPLLSLRDESYTVYFNIQA